MEYNIIDVIIVALLIAISSGTVGAIFKSVYDRHCKKTDKQAEILKQLHKQAIDISQLKITTMVHTNSKEHKAIIDECEHYFLGLRADSWVWGIVNSWSKSEKVDVGYLEAAHERNKKEKLEEKNIF